MAKPQRTVALIAVLVIVSGCSAASPDVLDGSTTIPPLTTIGEASTTTTTTEPPTSTSSTTEPPLEISSAINGLPVEAGAADRRVVAVKIDHHADARPQSGLEVADAVYELLVEGGITRLIALFHQSDSAFVGPNRSGRPTDAKLITALNGAPFQISGAQGWVQDIFKDEGVNVIYDTGVTTFRRSNRKAPHNLYTSTELIRSYADRRGWPDEGPGNLFDFGEAPTEGEAATHIEIAFSNAAPSVWDWDGSVYLHSVGSEEHTWITDEGEEGRVAFDVLVVMHMRKFIMDDPVADGTSLPTVDSVGTGEAWVFHGGIVRHGRWERGSKSDRFFLIGDDGLTLTIPPGRLWMMLPPDTESIVWD